MHTDYTDGTQLALKLKKQACVLTLICRHVSLSCGTECGEFPQAAWALPDSVMNAVHCQCEAQQRSVWLGQLLIGCHHHLRPAPWMCHAL